MHGFPLFPQLLCLFQQSWGEGRAGVVGDRVREREQGKVAEARWGAQLLMGHWL